jgi:hypothetical protein
MVCEWTFRRTPKGREVRVYLESRDVAALEDLGGGSAGYGAEQVIRGHLAGLRLRALGIVHGVGDE